MCVGLCVLGCCLGVFRARLGWYNMGLGLVWWVLRVLCLWFGFGIFGCVSFEFWVGFLVLDLCVWFMVGVLGCCFAVVVCFVVLVCWRLFGVGEL